MKSPPLNRTVPSLPQQIRRLLHYGDRLWGPLTIGMASLVLLLVISIGWLLWQDSAVARATFGWNFLLPTSEFSWNPVAGNFQAWPFIYGTLVTSLAGNIAGFEYTLSRPFCGSCHVMGPYLRDAEDSKSKSLAAIHSRNHRFGENSCYNCHADYKIFGAVTTKATGMRHLFKYVTEYANTGPDGEGGPFIKLYKREDLEHGKMTEGQFNRNMNDICMQCHSTRSAIWMEKHDAVAEDVRDFKQICIDCHSDIHPLALSRRPGARKEQK